MFGFTLKILKYILLVVLSCTIVFLVNGTFEKMVVQNRIKEFKARGVLISEDDSYLYGTTYYYQIQRKYDYEDTSRNIYNAEKRVIGSKGDIILTNRNPMRRTSVEGIVGFLSENFYIGHATLVSTDDGGKIYEVLGNSSNPENNIVAETRNNWITADSGDTPVIIGLRIKNTDEVARDKMVEYAKSKEGYPYNFSFLFNRANSFYCTDLVSRAVAYAGLNVNYDYLATTGNDMIISNSVYIMFIREQVIDQNKNMSYHIYYLV